MSPPDHGSTPNPRSRSPRPFDRVLVANRGEIAVRIIRTLRRLGIRSIAVYSDADAAAPHVRLADEAVRIGPASASESYLVPERIVAAALESGAEAIHPGYGFLSEHAGFAEACRDAGLVFVGPGIEALEVMGDKIRAKRHVEASGVPTVPGIADPALDDAALLDASATVGFPLLVKPSAGGGGKGMQIARDADELAAALPAARRIALAAFGDDTLLIERLIERPRHIEVQVLADAAGTVIHLGERECSLQRRHQKVIEEAPSPLLDEATRARIGAAACDAARSVGYLGAGTVEFLVSDAAPDEFFFIEMNTRLQVEHPVTELVTGVDLVEQQLRIAADEPLAITQEEVRLTGHAIEARVYAEAPERGFLPSTGRVVAWREPAGPGVRVDGGIVEGQEITAHYDPMLAKVIAYGDDRAEALDRLDRALADTVVLGVDTNLAFLRRLIADPAVRAGDLDTGLIDRLPEPTAAEPSPGLLAAAAGLVAEHDRVEHDGATDAAGPRAWLDSSGWRPGPHRAPVVLLAPRDSVDDVREVAAGAVDTSAEVDGVLVRRDDDGTVWVHRDGETAAFTVLDRRARAAARRRAAERGGLAAAPELRAPMPGTVTAVLVADGDSVEAGDAVVAIEAMKMEHRVLATLAGLVRLAAATGDLVSRDQVVARIEPHPAASDPQSSSGPHEGAAPEASHQE
ncbi:acetyl-CoA/propionyl-CoA carboxylase biotin carboxyl carrier protein [Agromyces sp. 3263]|uniref:acetyl/propionyl/methylcrotonyl-CoA carboxylase subunit alpha n=1 Tax=Agromyces sp. 3263 TaxID=2817750 RepID=UPI00285D33C3|nr:biotin carboxylase N-terminal domain-containing protein [Agromyces sp. 3263]MDR6904384.1 acetyl-CoA/propionyl-CoA carboxylase biotin carboxyl carrier protein [Agromyces sp. 3263]